MTSCVSSQGRSSGIIFLSQGGVVGSTVDCPFLLDSFLQFSYSYVNNNRLKSDVEIPMAMNFIYKL